MTAVETEGKGARCGRALLHHALRRQVLVGPCESDAQRALAPRILRHKAHIVANGHERVPGSSDTGRPSTAAISNLPASIVLKVVRPVLIGVRLSVAGGWFVWRSGLSRAWQPFAGHRHSIGVRHRPAAPEADNGYLQALPIRGRPVKAAPTSFLFIVLMSLLGAMSAFATDMSLAAVEPMARDLGVSTNTVGLSLSAFMLSFALSPLVYGPLSDRFGRRPVALLACTVYVIGGIGCVFAGSLPALLACRFVQGIGGGARPLGLAIIGDHFKGAVAREKMSYVSALSLLAPLLAPSIGALLMVLGSWRWIYLFLTLTGAVALLLVHRKLGESLPEERRVAVSPKQVARNYASVFRNRRSLPFALIAVAMFGVIFGYVSGSPYVMIGAFHLTPHAIWADIHAELVRTSRRKSDQRTIEPSWREARDPPRRGDCRWSAAARSPSSP